MCIFLYSVSGVKESTPTSLSLSRKQQWMVWRLFQLLQKVQRVRTQTTGELVLDNEMETKATLLITKCSKQNLMSKKTF